MSVRSVTQSLGRCLARVYFEPVVTPVPVPLVVRVFLCFATMRPSRTRSRDR
jgi:hypothetical protein